jgi:hypothetical protein
MDQILMALMVTAGVMAQLTSIFIGKVAALLQILIIVVEI